MSLILIVFLFVLWSIFGSLGSVLITRLGEGVNEKVLRGIFFGFSQCPKCKRQLKPKNLVPIVSFLMQKWKCEYCHKDISKFYPMLEILSGLVFVLTFILAQNLVFWTGTLVFFLLINRLLLLLIVYDFQKMELHVPLRVVALAVALLGQFAFSLGNYGQAFYLSLILGWVCVGLFYGAKWYVKTRYKKDEEWFGQGDVMLGFLLGTLMSFVFSVNHISFSFIHVLEILILFFVLSSLLGLTRYGIQYLFRTSPWLKLNVPKELLAFNVLPFIPFMIFAFWILLFAGKFFINLVFSQW